MTELITRDDSKRNDTTKLFVLDTQRSNKISRLNLKSKRKSSVWPPKRKSELVRLVLYFRTVAILSAFFISNFFLWGKILDKVSFEWWKGIFNKEVNQSMWKLLTQTLLVGASTVGLRLIYLLITYFFYFGVSWLLSQVVSSTFFQTYYVVIKFNNKWRNRNTP